MTSILFIFFVCWVCDRYFNGGLRNTRAPRGQGFGHRQCFRLLSIQIWGLFVTQHHGSQSSLINDIVADQSLALT